MMRCLGMDDLTPSEQKTLAAIAYHDGPGGCYPSLDRIAELLSLTRFDIARYIKALEKKGRLRRRRRPQETSEYEVVYADP